MGAELGGWASEPTNLVEIFNLLDKSWSVSTLKLPGSSRAYHGMEILDGSIWVVGGFVVAALLRVWCW